MALVALDRLHQLLHGDLFALDQLHEVLAVEDEHARDVESTVRGPRDCENLAHDGRVFTASEIADIKNFKYPLKLILIVVREMH
jgi:hypothetical protein